MDLRSIILGLASIFNKFFLNPLRTFKNLNSNEIGGFLYPPFPVLSTNVELTQNQLRNVVNLSR